MAKKPTIKVLSITYKVGNKTFTATPPTNNRGINDENNPALLPLEGPLSADDGDFKCINGVLHMLVCVGGICHWVSLNKPCQ